MTMLDLDKIPETAGTTESTTFGDEELAAIKRAVDTTSFSDEISEALIKSDRASVSVKKFATHLSVISKKYDLDGDGILNEAERALRSLDRGDGGGLDKNAVYQHIQELMSTQKQLMNTKRLLWFVTLFALLMMISIFGLSFAVAKLMDDTDIKGGSPIEGTAELVSSEDSSVVVATVAEGYVVHAQELSVDPYDLASGNGSLFFPDGKYSTTVDAFQCTKSDYLTGSKLLGQIDGCRGILHAAETGQSISFLSADERNLLPGQSLMSLSVKPTEVWVDPIRASPSDSFYKETAYLIIGTAGEQCRLFVFIEDVGEASCPFYELPGCVMPDCVLNPPEYEPTNNPEQERPYPQP